MTGHRTPHTALTMLRESSLEESSPGESSPEVSSPEVSSPEVSAEAQSDISVILETAWFWTLFTCLPDIPGPPPPHHHPNQRLPPPGMPAEHPPWGGGGGGQHQDFGPPPHGFNGHSPHVRHRQTPVQDDPSLVPNVPYFDLPAGLMAPLVKVSHLLLMWSQEH